MARLVDSSAPRHAPACSAAAGSGFSAGGSDSVGAADRRASADLGRSDLPYRRAQVSEDGDRPPNDRLLLLGQPFAPDPVVGRHPDRDAVDAAVQAGPVVAGRLDDAGRIGRVVYAQHPEHDGVVGHRPGQRAGRVDAPRDRPYAHPADAAEGGLEADQVTVAGGVSDGPGGVGADGEQAERRRDGRPGAATGRPPGSCPCSRRCGCSPACRGFGPPPRRPCRPGRRRPPPAARGS